MEDNNIKAEIKTKKNPFFRFIKWFLITIISIPILVLLVLLAMAIISRAEPTTCFPDNFKAYASLPQSGIFVRNVIDLEAVDAILAGPEMGNMRALVQSIRSTPFLRTKSFDFLTNIRIDAATYDKGFIAVALLGYRSAILKPLPLVLKLLPKLINTVPNLEYVQDNDKAYFKYTNNNSNVFIMPIKNVVIIASSKELLYEAAQLKSTAISQELASTLKSQNKQSLRLVIKPLAFLNNIKSDIFSKLLNEIEFPKLALVDLFITQDKIQLNIDMPISSKSNNKDFVDMISRKSKVPAVLSKFPESLSYYSLLSVSKIDMLWKALYPFFTKSIIDAYKNANSAASFAFDIPIDTLLFSWMGSEVGVFGSSLGIEPVFFTSIDNEKERKAIFDKVFSSSIVGRDASVVVDDIRIPRIVFPDFIRGLLSMFDVNIPQPFYIVDDGYLYISQSAELLAACIKEKSSGKLLIKNDKWKIGQNSLESAVSMFYSLDRSVPFFLKGNSSIHSALKLYGKGFASIGFEKGKMLISLTAVKLDNLSGPKELAGFPIKLDSKITSNMIAAKSKKGSAYVYWADDNIINAMNLSSGGKFLLETDGKCYIAADIIKDKLNTLWAVSEQGTVYMLDPELVPMQGFPIMTGQSVSGQINIASGQCIIPILDQNSIMFVKANGEYYFSISLSSKIKTRPVVLDKTIAVLPRSFDSELYLLDSEGKVMPNWPIALNAIAQAEPTLFFEKQLYVCAISESGQIYMFTNDGNSVAGFPLSLESSCDTAVVWSKNWKALYALTSDAVLYKIGLDGVVQNSVKLDKQKTKANVITLCDINNDGRDELFISGGGDALYAYSGDLLPLKGFPVSGAAVPYWLDINGDGRDDMLVQGSDNSIHAYKLP